MLAGAGDFAGAREPSPSIPPAELPGLLMRALKLNDFPEVDSGLLSMWAFAGDTMRFLYQNNSTEFVKDAHETADSLPTSFYGTAMRGQSWALEGNMTMVGGSDDPWIATQIMRTVASDGRMRRWQWECVLPQLPTGLPANTLCPLPRYPYLPP